MEYATKASATDAQTLLTTEDQTLVVVQGSSQKSIPYSAINEVRLRQMGDQHFQATLFGHGFKPLVISSLFFHDNGSVENCGSSYAAFIRVLHYHLREKGNATFCTGMRRREMTARLVLVFAISAVASGVIDMFELSGVNAFLQGGIIAFILTAALCLAAMHNLPRRYEPSEIPINFLPR
jgi:hypothetical protein